MFSMVPLYDTLLSKNMTNWHNYREKALNECSLFLLHISIRLKAELVHVPNVDDTTVNELK